jgi:pyruvate dehydrogenase E2 component (dihydrolipoamide acetyltransferase)
LTEDVIMPALGMSQKTGVLLRWLKREGENVTKGEPVMEVETDKATVEIEAPASGKLSRVNAREGDEVPVGQVVAVILPPGKMLEEPAPQKPSGDIEVSPLARRIAEERGVDLSQVKPAGERVRKEDVLAYLEHSQTPEGAPAMAEREGASPSGLRIPASPKARRIAAESGLDLHTLSGSGLEGAVLAADVIKALSAAPTVRPKPASEEKLESLGSTWKVMANRMAESWTSAPHFYLVREVHAAGLVDMRQRVSAALLRRGGIKPTYTDLLVKLAAAALRDHPRLNASWAENGIQNHTEINIGLAVGIEDGLVVPVIHNVDRLSLAEIAAQRQDLSDRAGEHRLRPEELSGGTFTITNLGMYNVDAFMAVLNPPQAAILAVGRIADRVVPENGQPVVRPMLVLTLSCDHRVADGVRAAKFLDDLTLLVEEPWGLMA